MRRASLLAVLALTACTAGEPVAWDDAAPVAPEPPPVALPADAPADPARCPGSLVAARAAADEYVVWWSARADSSVWLVAAHRTRGGAWGPTASVDTADQGRRGCDRPAPAAAADSATGYVHVAYFLDAPEGAGVFFAHSMDRGGMYHSPVGVAYGDAPARAAVAARGDTVAVAYEDPGRDPDRGRPSIGLALSVTSGHIFETHGVAVSSGDSPSTRPTVALGPDRHVTVWWDEPGAATGGPPQRRSRTGRLR